MPNHLAKRTVARESRARRRERAEQILALLYREHPDASCALDHDGPFQLLVATILSAQCTDERVNRVTPELFRRWPDSEAMATATLEELEEVIRSTGFFRSKAKSLSGTANRIQEHYGGEVPGSLEELTTLPGAARKTANVVLGNAFGVPGITVDTHVGRIARRLGLTKEKDPVKVEKELGALIPQADWTRFSHATIFHGRRVCDSRKPACADCALAELCPAVGVEPAGSAQKKKKPAARKGTASFLN
jgi:endonuclease-3